MADVAVDGAQLGAMLDASSASTDSPTALASSPTKKLKPPSTTVLEPGAGQDLPAPSLSSEGNLGGRHSRRDGEGDDGSDDSLF